MSMLCLFYFDRSSGKPEYTLTPYIAKKAKLLWLGFGAVRPQVQLVLVCLGLGLVCRLGLNLVKVRFSYNLN